MLLPESFPIFHSLPLVLAASITIFFWRFYVFREKLIKEFKSLPSIVVLGMKGSGKTSFINMVTKSYPSLHPFQNLNVATTTLGDQKFQFIELPHLVDGQPNILQELKKMNLKYFIYLFDVSENSEPIENQLKNFENIRKFFDGYPFLLVANKVDVAKKEKLERLEGRFKNIYKISSLGKGLADSNKSMFMKELEDLSSLIHDLSHEILIEKEEAKSLTQS
ncbi:MAG: GTPase [Candidatus Aenigmatarchaeota archaeon]